MGKTLSKPRARKRPGKVSSRRVRKAKPILTKEELHEWGKTHPVPASFWDGEDDPSKPAKG